MKRIGIAIPFRIKNGKILVSQEEARVREKLRAIFNIFRGEYYLDRGLGLENFLFANFDPAIINLIKRNIKEYIPEIEINSIQARFEEGILRITIRFQFENKEEKEEYVTKII